MRAITIMYDSLNRLFLPNYGDMETIAPNFKAIPHRKRCQIPPSVI